MITWNDLMSESANHLQTAKTLPDIPRREVLARSAIRGSYYAAYHAAHSLAKRQGYVRPSTLGSHAALWLWWFAEERPDAIGPKGGALRQERVRADYKLKAHVSVAGAEIVLADARALIALIESR